MTKKTIVTCDWAGCLAEHGSGVATYGFLMDDPPEGWVLLVNHGETTAPPRRGRQGAPGTPPVIPLGYMDPPQAPPAALLCPEHAVALYVLVSVLKPQDEDPRGFGVFGR